MEEGFLPVLIAVDETLWEMLILNADPESDGAEDYGFDPIQVAKYRKAALSAAPLDGKTVLQSRMNDRISELEDDDMSLEEITGAMEGGEPGTGSCPTGIMIQTHLSADSGKDPGEESLGSLCLPALRRLERMPRHSGTDGNRRYWLEQYGAVPAVITHDVLECALPAPVPEDQAMELAHGTVRVLSRCRGPGAGGRLHRLAGRYPSASRTKWFFWWD